jgi:hypothetical protein
MERSLNAMSKQMEFVDQSTGEVFSYAQLSREDEAAAREDAAIIKTNLRTAAESVITVGQALIRQKSRLGHGRFLGWIEAEFGMTERSSQRFMKIAEVFAGKPTGLSHLGVEALYELAAPSTPQDIRDRVEDAIANGEMIIDGEKITAASIRRMKAEMRAAQEAASRLQDEVERNKPSRQLQVIDTEALKASAEATVRSQLQDEIEAKQRSVSTLQDENSRLRKELEILKAAPVPAGPEQHENVITHSFRTASDDFYDEDMDDGIRNEGEAVRTFCGGLKAIASLSFSPAAFVAYADPQKVNGKEIRDALFSVNSTISTLLKEMSRNA